MNNLVKIKSYTVGQRGERKNIIVSLPPVWLEQNKVSEGDIIDFLQSPDSPDLILRKGNGIKQPAQNLDM